MAGEIVRKQPESARAIGDDEVLYRRIPPGEKWLEPPDRLTTANFKLNRKRNELGLSVYRRAVVSAREVLDSGAAIPGSRLASATAGQVRALTNALGVPLQLDVLAIDDEDNPGHAEIRGPEPGKLLAAASKALCNVFTLVPDSEMAGGWTTIAWAGDFARRFLSRLVA